MGLILNSSAVIAGERKGLSAADLLTGIRAIVGPEPIAFSTVNVIELEHGIWRARDAAQASRRRQFFDDLFAAIPVYPLTFEIARRAARIDGESKQKGITIPFQDLVIGVTALEFGYAVAQSDPQHKDGHMQSKQKRKTARQNGAKAAGSKTPQGILTSAMNALRHGLTSQTQVLANESPSKFAELLQMYIKKFKPQDGVEMNQVDESFGGLVVGAGYYGLHDPFRYSPFIHPGSYTGFMQQPNMGQVKLDIVDKDASVYVDDAYAGSARKLKICWLAPGVSNLELRDDKQRSFRQRVCVRSGKTLAMRPRLQPEEAK